MAFQIPHTDVHRLSRHLLEPPQDMLVLGIGLALFGLMVHTLVWLTPEIFRGSLDSRGVIAQVLFMLVMMEVVRLVIIYLDEHRVAVDFMGEPGIVATLREIVLRGLTELAWPADPGSHGPSPGSTAAFRRSARCGAGECNFLRAELRLRTKVFHLMS